MSEDQKIKILFGLGAKEGGSLKHLLYLLTYLDRNIFKITVMLSAGPIELDIEQLKKTGVEVLRFPIPQRISFVGDFYCLIHIIIHLFKFKYDIVHAHSSKAGFYLRIASWLNKVPTVIYTPHCFYFQAHKGIKKFIYRWIEKLLGYITHRVILSDNETKDCLKSHIVPRYKLFAINNAINFNDYALYDKKTCLKSFGLIGDFVVIGAVGRLVKQKDIATFINAAFFVVNRIPDARFLIAGTGSLQTDLAHKITELGIQDKVKLIGHQENISKMYSAIDIFVSTSLWEGLPYVLLEAMWFRKPIVSTNFFYDEVLFNDDKSFLIDAFDGKTLSSKLFKLIENKKLREEIGERNRDLIEANFLFDTFIQRHQQLYLDAVGRIDTL